MKNFNNLKQTSLILLFLILIQSIYTQNISIVSDLNTISSSSSYPAYMYEYNNKMYFNANDGVNGAELWEYDGTNPPEMIKDINVGDENSSPRYFTEFNGLVFFNANDGINGKELWSYDNTADTTTLYDIVYGSSGSNPSNFIVFNNKLYFQANDGVNGKELWVFDGTNNPAMVADIQPGNSSSSPAYLTVYNNKLFFQADDGTNGKELWVYDGTNPPAMIYDLYPGSSGSNPSYLTIYSNKLYLQINDGTTGAELWEYDGISSFEQVMDIASGSSSSNPKYMTVFNNKLYFQADNDTIGSELWVYDGMGYPVAVADIYSGSIGSNPSYLITYNNKLYFQADDGSNGAELWEYDGINNPALVQDIRVGSSSSNPTYFYAFNNNLYFQAINDTHGMELMEFNGDTVTVHTDINPGNNDSDPAYLVSYNDTLYFSANDGSNGAELWRYDGTNTPSMFANIYSGVGSSIPSYLYVFNNQLYFSADDAINGNELWSYDSIYPPLMVDNIRSGSADSDPSFLIEYHDSLFFAANDGTNGTELWVYDGSSKPSMIFDINSGSSGSSPMHFAVFNNKLYFQADDGTSGPELWVYDGTNDPTIVEDIKPGIEGSSPAYLDTFNNKLYFQADDGTDGPELWMYNGTNAPEIVYDIYDGSSGSSPGYLTQFNDKLYFKADDNVLGAELWVYDGINTPEIVSDIYPDSLGSEPKYLTVFEDKLYFQADDSTNGAELWVYDGISDPAMVIDIYSGSSGSNPTYLTEHNGSLFFSANDGIHGNELWALSPERTLSVKYNTNNESCEGKGDGSIEAIVSGGLKPYTFLWSTGDTISFISGLSSGTYILSLTDANDSSIVDIIEVSANPLPPVDAGDSINACIGSSITLAATGGTEYIWSTGDSVQSVILDSAVAGLYYVTVTENGCSAVDSVLVTFHNYPSNDTIYGIADICTGSNSLFSVEYDTIDNYTFSWTINGANNGKPLIVAGQGTEEVFASPKSTTWSGSVDVEIASAYGCKTLVSKPISVIDAPKITASEDTIICQGDSVTLKASSTDTLIWNTGDTTLSIKVSPAKSTQYYVTASNGSCTSKEIVNVLIDDIPDPPTTQNIAIRESDTIPELVASGDNVEWFSDSLLANKVSDTNTYTPIVSGIGEYIYYVIQSNNDCSSQYAIASLTVHIDNYLPEVDDSVFFIEENSPIGSIVGYIEANDKDEDQELKYTILFESPENAFDLDSISGEIFSKIELDYESDTIYALQVKVEDNHPDKGSNSANIAIKIIDVNEAPYIQPNHIFYIDGELDKDESIGSVTSSDPDGDTILYSLDDNTVKNLFAIDEFTGELTSATDTVIAKLNQYAFLIKVEDDTKDKLSNKGIVTIIVETSPLEPIEPVNIENTTFERINIYPNPVLGKLYIDVHKNIDECLIEIIAPNGQKLYKQQHHLGDFGQYQIDVSWLEQGVYVVKFITDNVIYQYRFVKM